MADEQRLSMTDEIKRIERELYLKKSKLASDEAMDYGITKMLPYLSAEGLNKDKWKEVFSKLIEKIGDASPPGGDSVKDMEFERRG